MIQHPWAELQVIIKEKWLTQKAFSSILWKKISEVNELLKWKRNITIQRDYLLHQTLWTPMKYWIMKQVDYDYSLLNIEESASIVNKNEFKEDSNSQTINSSSKTKNILNDDNIDNENWQENININKQEDSKRRADIFRSF